MNVFSGAGLQKSLDQLVLVDEVAEPSLPEELD
jgi:hypothetical protein